MCKFVKSDDYQDEWRRRAAPSLGNGSFPPLRDAEIKRLQDRLAYIDAQIEGFWPSDESMLQGGVGFEFWVNQRSEVVDQLEAYGQDVDAIEADIIESRTPHVLSEAPDGLFDIPSLPEFPVEPWGCADAEMNEWEAWPDDGDPYGPAAYPL